MWAVLCSTSSLGKTILKQEKKKILLFTKSGFIDWSTSEKNIICSNLPSYLDTEYFPRIPMRTF
jgi:hypothetical protein